MCRWWPKFSKRQFQHCSHFELFRKNGLTPAILAAPAPNFGGEVLYVCLDGKNHGGKGPVPMGRHAESALAFFVAPVIFFLNLYYCFAVIPKTDRLFYPSVFATWFGWASMVVFSGMSFLLIMARVFQIPLFGA